MATSVLITGTDSGLGRHLRQHLGGERLTRRSTPAELAAIQAQPWEVIIHCAFNPCRSVGPDEIHAYYEDNLKLTEDLVQIPHRRFIYLSSVDVYPPGARRCVEQVETRITPAASPYALCKLLAEAMVRRHSRAPLIIRPAAMLGPHSRENSLIRLVRDRAAALTLSGDSSMNYVLHRDVRSFIVAALRQELVGAYNLASSANITLQQAAELVGADHATFGRHRYHAGRIDNHKAAAVLPALEKTSAEVIQAFIAEQEESG